MRVRYGSQPRFDFRYGARGVRRDELIEQLHIRLMKRRTEMPGKGHDPRGRKNNVVKRPLRPRLGIHSDQKKSSSFKTWRVFLDGRPLELVTSTSSRAAIAYTAECYAVPVRRLAALDEGSFERFERQLERSRRRRLPATCYHEAGHTVMAHHLGGIVVFVSAIPELTFNGGVEIETRCLGYCEWRTPINHPRWIPGTALDREGRAFVSLAGLAAEFRLVGRSRWLSHSFAEEVERAVALAEQCGETHPAKIERIFETWKEAAEAKIEYLWDHITRVANALIEHREVSRQGLERLLRPIPRIGPETIVLRR